MSDAIQDAINAAKSAGATVTATTETPDASNANLPATAPRGSAVAAPVAQTALSASDMMQGSFSVDAFLKVDENGIKIGDKPGLIENLKVSIDMAEAYYYYGVKFGNNPVSYKKTQNRVMSLDNQPWGDVLAMAARVDGAKFKGEYRSGDIPMVLLEAAKDLRGQVVGEAGLRVGKSLSTTEWKEWEGFLRSVIKAGLDADKEVVEVDIGFKARSNTNNKWGVLTFTLLGAYDADQAQAA